jgi:UDP-galactopyranose mutase
MKRSEEEYDLIVAGAGPVGCVIADRAAREMGWRCLVLEKRSHIAGNCHDSIDENGILLHRYGPHCFRTWDKALLDYLGNYTEWIPGNHRVQALHKGQLYPIPINLTTLELFFGQKLTEESGRALIEKKRYDIKKPKNSEEFILSRVGRELYEAFYQGYTIKQWGINPRELEPSVCGRVPIRMNRDDRYVDETYQFMPKEGYTALFEKMLRHPLIDVRLNCDYLQLRGHLNANVAIVYTGPIDAYFDYCQGPLPYRSLHFEWVLSNREFDQPCLAINYPSDHEYTRSVEIKHITGQKHPKSVIALEFPRSEGEPFYPIPTETNYGLHELYRRFAAKETEEKRIYFCGRLATYSYLNIDTAILSALNLHAMIKRRHFHGNVMDRRPGLQRRDESQGFCS